MTPEDHGQATKERAIEEEAMRRWPELNWASDDPPAWSLAMQVDRVEQVRREHRERAAGELAETRGQLRGAAEENKRLRERVARLEIDIADIAATDDFYGAGGRRVKAERAIGGRDDS